MGKANTTDGRKDGIACKATGLTLLRFRGDGPAALHAEAVLGRFARRTGVKRAALETVAVHREALIGSGSPAEQLDRLRRAVSNLESGRARQTADIVSQAWARADLATLERLGECCDTPAQTASYDRLLFNRDPGFAERSAVLRDAGRRPFAAVGILHPVGANAVQKLLATRGFTVERIVPGDR